MFYKGKNVGLYYADLLINQKYILEIKSVKKIILPHIFQLKNYLKATGYSDGFIFNFNNPSLEYKRVFPF